jgi:hypothetical protein
MRITQYPPIFLAEILDIIWILMEPGESAIKLIINTMDRLSWGAGTAQRAHGSGGMEQCIFQNDRRTDQHVLCRSYRCRVPALGQVGAFDSSSHHSPERCSMSHSVTAPGYHKWSAVKRTPWFHPRFDASGKLSVPYISQRQGSTFYRCHAGV